MLIDTHSHIYSEEFNDDINEVISRCREVGVNKIVLPNVDEESIEPMMTLCEKYPEMCYPLMGLHPTSVTEDYIAQLDLVKEWFEKRTFYGVGEIGIDLYWDRTFLKQQIEAFEEQIKMAKEMKLPVVIHVRDSFDEVFDVVGRHAGDELNGIFHSFTGNEEQAKQIVDWGFKLGINGIVTFKNSGLDKVVATVDPKNLVVETDAPYLAPVPYRGKRNESGYVRLVANKLADVYGLAVEDIEQITSQNAIELFNI
ncbi:TatD family deoxyribonuclease [Puteibacter caeruleilacunae]|nr:TatD family deoxyribonuclease [Puteibacter caeruleilacunae]